MTTSMYSKLMTRAFAGFITWVLLCGSAFTVSAQDYYVATNGNDSASGTSWANALLTISNAIAKASAGQTVAVSNGTYVLSKPLTLNKGVTLQGFGGASNTVIDANLTGRILSISDNAAVVDGFTLKNGRTTGVDWGIGVYMSGGTLQNCTISSCTNTVAGATRGGGVCVNGPNGLVTNCVITGNYLGNTGDSGSDPAGGGVWVWQGKLLGCVVTNNTLHTARSGGGGAGGGGVYVGGGGIVSNCLIAGNSMPCVDPTAIVGGGGVFVDGGQVFDCVVSNNSCSYYRGSPGGEGGGVRMRGASLVERCVITRNYLIDKNSAAIYGGGVACEGGVMRNCLISGNWTTRSLGGGVYLNAGSVLDCVVSNNTVNADRTSNRGGGGFYVTGSGMVSNCTVSGNAVTCVDAITYGGGIFAAGGTVVDCVISNNSAAGFASRYAAGGGLYTTQAALVERCVITRNYLVDNGASAYRYGGGAYSDGGIMRNCLIMGNTANREGGGLYMTGGTNENCTIVRNNCSAGNYGGVYWTNSPVIVNAIVYNNTGAIENNILPIVGGLSQVTYSCSPSLTSGTGNVTADPLFVDSGIGSGISFTAGDYRPVLGSPCEKTGLVAGWMSTALDLAGLPRLSSGQVEMGAYAAVPSKSTYVAESGNDSNAGTSWESPFRTIQKGIDGATALGTVSVSNGTYVLTSQLLLGKACTLVGMGGREQTIIDANATGRILTIDNANAVVDGFTLKNGKSTVPIDGLGVYMTGGTLQNCTISSCTNTGWNPIRGGGLFMSGSGCLVTNCVIENNHLGQEWAESRGGGVYLSAGKLVASTVKNNSLYQGRYNGGGAGVFVTGAGSVSNCVISGNGLSSLDAPAVLGGGLYVDWGTVADCVITNNSCNVERDAGGGGVFVAGGGTVLNSLIAGNSIPCVDPTVATGGGGVYVDGGRVVGCVVSNNSSSYYRGSPGTFGGGVRMTGTSLVERCVITQNYLINKWHSARYGGGVSCEGGVMRNCLIMGNKANAQGGGLYMTGGTNENCTIVRNQCLADADGAGLYGGVYWTNTPVIVNAIVYNNTSSSGESNILAVVGGVSGVTYSCAPSLTSGTLGNITADPLFTASGTGYGTTFVAGDYRLAAGTPCLNKGLNELRMKTATDLDGLPRVKDFIVDMGAYERQITSGSIIKFF